MILIFICFYFSRFYVSLLFVDVVRCSHFLLSLSHFAVHRAHAPNTLIKTTFHHIQQTQSKCSIFRDVMLCLCLNLTYANVVRFPRELDRHGVAFLIPYLLLFLLVGMPIILLEIALGQFLGQGSAHSWRASPIFRGKFIIKYTKYIRQLNVCVHRAARGLHVSKSNRCDGSNNKKIV